MSEVVHPMDETGNADFNLADALPLTEDEIAPPYKEESAPVNFQALDKVILAKRDGTVHTPPDLAPAMSAVTAEDLAFERELQRMHLESPITKAETEKPIIKEVVHHDFLGDAMENYRPAATLNELEQQAWAAKSIQADSIEATEQVIRYFTKDAYPDKVGYFIYKNIKVFIPGFIKSIHNVDTDKQNLASKLVGLNK